MNINLFHTIYFMGIGGIGMSALARYFNTIGKNVSGYDKTETTLTNTLIKEGISIIYTDTEDVIPYEIINNKHNTLIVRTPAVPANSIQLNYFINNQFTILKRAEVLGLLSQNYKTLTVAGTHGKTTTSTLLAHIVQQSEFNCIGFLGGISKNYNSNLILPENSENSTFCVTEADEYDRSFLHLHPYISVITSVDADHLDIYENADNMHNSYIKFALNTASDGAIIVNHKAAQIIKIKHTNYYTYSLTENTSFHTLNLKLINGFYNCDIITPFGLIEDVTIGARGLINVENTVGAVAAAACAGISFNTIKEAVASYMGVSRRLDFKYQDNKTIYIDDYAHHPEELKACISSVKQLFPDKKITGIFQPHLFSRTRDFANEFAISLELLDIILLMEIYPARELPISGINSQMLLNKINKNTKTLASKEEILNLIQLNNYEIILTLGAGNIDTLAPEIITILKNKI